MQELHGLLQQANVPDTSTVKAATEALQTRYLKNAQAVPALFEILATSPELAVRQLAGVELRKKLANASSGKNYIETVWGRGYVLREPTDADERIPA